MDEVERRTVHHTQLPEARPGDVLSQEWNTYRREAARLLAQGHAAGVLPELVVPEFVK